MVRDGCAEFSFTASSSRRVISEYLVKTAGLQRKIELALETAGTFRRLLGGRGSREGLGLSHASVCFSAWPRRSRSILGNPDGGDLRFLEPLRDPSKF